MALPGFRIHSTTASLAAILVAWGTLHSCASRPVSATLVPVTVEPRTQLVVANHTGEARFEETVSRHLLAKWVTASARIRVEAVVSVDYYYDFKADGGRLAFDPNTGIARFTGGPLRAKKPVVLSAKVLILEKSIWIHEEKEALAILEHLGDRLGRFGDTWRDTPVVQGTARRGLRDFMEHLAMDRHWTLTSLIDGTAPTPSPEDSHD